MHLSCLVLGVTYLLGAGQARPGDAHKPAASYQVPYRLTNVMHIMVRAKINGKGPYNFILDTGAPVLVVSTSVGKKLGLAAGKSGSATLDRFEIEGGPVRKKMKCRVETPFQLEGMNGFGMAGMELHGMMGYTVLAHYRIELDFTRDVMTWTELDFTPPPPKSLRAKDTGELAGLEFLGTLLKFVGFLSGKDQDSLQPRGYWGVELVDSKSGVSVKRVLPDTPAARAGLLADDNIERVQDRRVRTMADLRRVIARILPGAEIRITLRRQQELREITLSAGEGL
jgi:hypothetical protein